MIQRIDELTSPPEIGISYLVPTVIGEWYGSTRAWPVIGPKHNDAQCLRFDPQHYHLDVRFLPRFTAEWRWTSAFSSPLQTNGRVNPDGLPEPVWRTRKCKRLGNPLIGHIHDLVDTSGNWRCHFDQWEGKQARHDGRGWVCPHRSVPLADHPAVNGVITCPLHLLRIDATTGVVLPREVLK